MCVCVCVCACVSQVFSPLQRSGSSSDLSIQSAKLSQSHVLGMHFSPPPHSKAFSLQTSVGGEEGT